MVNLYTGWPRLRRLRKKTIPRFSAFKYEYQSLVNVLKHHILQIYLRKLNTDTNANAIKIKWALPTQAAATNQTPLKYDGRVQHHFLFGLRRQNGRYCLPLDIRWILSQNPVQVGRWNWRKPTKGFSFIIGGLTDDLHLFTKSSEADSTALLSGLRQICVCHFFAIQREAILPIKATFH